MTTQLTVHCAVLGQTEIRTDGIRLTPEAERQFGMALFFCVNAGREVPRDEVAALFWPEHDTEAARHCLRQALYRLRAVGVPVRSGAKTSKLDERLVEADYATVIAEGASSSVYLALSELAVLPGYAPRFSAPFAEWVEDFRTTMTASLRRGLVRAIADSRARGRYGEGKFGAFRCGEAKLIEPYSYRHSNFQNWFTKQNTDPFTYVGCHYVDLTCFITGLKPTEVSVRGVEGAFPNGNPAYLWTAARVVFENGGVLSVINGLGYPDAGAGSNDQGMTLFFEGARSSAMIHHADQYRGVQHCYLPEASAGKAFQFVNPDFFRLVPWEGEGLKPVGYGYESIEANVRAVNRINEREAKIEAIEREGLIATPTNTIGNTLVTEAGRLSLLNGGMNVKIGYGPEPGVELQ